MDKIAFSLPGLYMYSGLNVKLVELIEKFPEYFNDNIKIDSIFGSIPCTWSGGRSYQLTDFTSEQVKEFVVYWNNKNIKIALTFTNTNINEMSINDVIGNMILKTVAENEKMINEIIVENDIIKNYIEKQYPDKFIFKYSITKCLKDIDEINMLSKNNIVSPDNSINNDFNKLKTLSYPENIELLLNEKCIDDCPFKRLHYESYSDYISKASDVTMDCPFATKTAGNYYDTVCKRKSHISFESINQNYLPLGINKFKISDREISIFSVIEGYLEYFVKSEHKNYVRLELLNSILSSQEL